MALLRGAHQANEALVRWVTSRLFGLGSRKEGVVEDTPKDEWNGRMNYIKTVVKEAVQESRVEIAADISALETVSKPRCFPHHVSVPVLSFTHD